MADDDGERPYFLTLDELRRIHNIVRDKVAAMTAGTVIRGDTIEHYIKSGGLRGFIDVYYVYCPNKGTYYEIKSYLTVSKKYSIVERQMKKYELIFNHIAPDMKPGTDLNIRGSFTFENKCFVDFHYVSPGLIEYTCSPIKKSTSRANNPIRAADSSYAMYIAIMAALMMIYSSKNNKGFSRNPMPVCFG